MGSENQNPRKWRYTWEAQSHLPLLKLFIFSPEINPICHCNHLNVDLKFEKSLLSITYKNDENSPNSISLFVPLPRVLVDLDSPLNFKEFEDHIQVKIPLLLPVDHPIVSSFISELNTGDDEVAALTSSDGFLVPLSMDSDFKALSSKGDVEFYCRNCAFKLTKRSVRCLVDLPSVNWTDVADNWFGTCCCSFGGISEKLVAKYVKSYRCAEGTCLLTAASVILCKDDIAGFKSLESDLIKDVEAEDKGPVQSACNSTNDVGASFILCKDDIAGLKSFESDLIKDGEAEDNRSIPSACNSNNDVGASIGVESPLLNDASPKLGSEHFPTDNHITGRECAKSDEDTKEKPSCAPARVGSGTDDESAHCSCGHDALESSVKDQSDNEPVALQADQKSFLNCYLGNAFSFRSDGLSKEIEWIDFSCPQCSVTLGSYPCSDGSEPLDGGIRLHKCYISISHPSKSSTYDLFSKYTLERMFTCQLLENAEDELSFRTVVKDLRTKSSMLHIVLLNPNSWCCTGCCSEGTADPIAKINLHPVVKVLFSDCNGNSDSKVRINEEWETKNRAEEIYMSAHVVRELIKYVKEATSNFPPSFSSSPGFLLSSIPR